MARVRIKKLPKALSGLEIKMQPGLYGTNGNRQFTLPTQVNSQKFAQQPTKVRDTLLPVARAGANLEAERGETAVVNIDGLPAHFKIGGKRHTQGGTPLNLPDNSFIFSDTAKMRIKDPVILAQFGMVPKKAGYTPAEIAKKYDINKFRQVLADANSEDLERKTAEMMISNYNMKLAKLALIQESMKGFPQGIPVIAMPYIMANEIDPSEYLPTQSQQEQPDANTGEQRYGGNIIAQFDTKAYGGVPMAQNGGGFWGTVLNVLEAPQRSMMYLGTGIADVVSDVASGRDIDWDAHYEMPSETLKRVAPNAGPGWGIAADILADPFLVTGIGKSLMRAGAKKFATKTVSKLRPALGQTATDYSKIASEVAGDITKKSKGYNKLNAEQKALRYIKNLEASQAAKKAAEKYVLKKGEKSSIRGMENAATRAASKVKSAQAAGKAGEVTKQVAKAAVKLPVQAAMLPVKGAQYVGKLANKYAPPLGRALEKTKDVIVSGAETVRGPVGEALLYPTAKVIGAGTKAVKSEKENEALREENEMLRSQQQDSWKAPKKIEKSTGGYKPVMVDGERSKYFTNPKEPGQLFIFAGGNYNRVNTPTTSVQQPNQDIKIITNPPKATVQKATVRPDTIRGASEEDINKLMGIDIKEEGGELYQAKDGVSVSNGKYYFTQGNKVYEITKEQYDSYAAKGDISYDTADEEARAKAGEKEYEFIDPADQFKYKGKNIGSQTAKTGYKIDPESGFYYDPTGAKGVKPGKAGLDDFVRRHKEIIDNYPGGEAQWKKDQVSAGGKKNKAMDHVVNELNKRHREISGNDLVDPNKPGAYIPGVELFNLPGINKKKAAPVQTPGVKPGKPAASDDPINRYPPMGILDRKRAPWWKQDIIGISGAAADLARVKRYPPWQAVANYALPEGTFYDPTRELAAGTEAAKLAIQAQQAFVNPQQLAAASSVAQGQMAKNAADIMGRYNNLNVGLANQLNQQRTDIMNTASANQAGMNTQLWDKYTTLNQQFDNSKAMARQNLRQRYIDAITNRSKTQALNTLYPNYYTDPSTGGDVAFNPGYGPTVPSQPNMQSDYQKALEITGDPQRALEYLRIQKGMSKNNSYGDDRSYQGYGDV
jgi:hypothetical protein